MLTGHCISNTNSYVSNPTWNQNVYHNLWQEHGDSDTDLFCSLTDMSFQWWYTVNDSLQCTDHSAVEFISRQFKNNSELKPKNVHFHSTLPWNFAHHGLLPWLPSKYFPGIQNAILTHSSVKWGVWFSTTMIWCEARYGLSGVGWHTQLGSGYSRLYLSIPSVPSVTLWRDFEERDRRQDENYHYTELCLLQPAPVWALDSDRGRRSMDGWLTKEKKHKEPLVRIIINDKPQSGVKYFQFDLIFSLFSMPAESYVLHPTSGWFTRCRSY